MKNLLLTLVIQSLLFLALISLFNGIRQHNCTTKGNNWDYNNSVCVNPDGKVLY